MDTVTTRQHSRSANPRFFCRHSPSGVGFILLGFVLFSFLWLGCEDVPTKYTVTFNTNGGTAVASQSVKKGDLVTNPADPTRKDYVFGGWYSDAGLTRVYDFKAAVNANITLYAKWTPAYTATFETNRGTTIPSQTVKKDGTVTKPADPTREGYVFENWYLDAGLTQVYDFASKMVGNITLYAKWRLKAGVTTYTVTFDTRGGTTIAAQTVLKDGTVTKPTDPTRAGFIFDNWYSDAGLTQVYDFKAAVNATITLYAKWKTKAGVTTYTVTFGTKGGTAIPPLAVAANGVATRPVADPTRKDYVFAGWYSDSTFTQVYDFAAKVTKAITLYAKWTRTYTVIFDSRGGTAIATQTVLKEGTVTKPADPTRKDYVFAGWYSDSTFTQVYDFAAKVTKAITLYAKWTRTYTVIFDSRGGTAIATQTVLKEGTVTKPADPTRKDYVFENWYSDSGLTQAYNFAAKVTKAITLYAKWTRNYTVTFDSRGGTVIAPQTVSKDSTVTKPADPTRKDYVFGGWYSDSGLMQVYDFTSKVTQDTTLYAKWTLFQTSFEIAAAGGAKELGTSATLQFSITNVEPAGADKRVTWSIEGGAGNGSIDANGLYTAPSAVPTPARITIKATGVADKTITATYSLTITNLVIIPDDNFRAKLKQLIPNAFVGDSLKITHKDVTGMQTLNVKSSSISSLEGIQYFTNLGRLICNDNSLTSLDVSSNTNLNWFVCHSNRLTSLDISKNKALTYLACFENPLTTLQISNNPALESLFCRSNGLTSLDVSKNTALEDLFCINNNLTSLDVSKNTALRRLDCSNNRLTALDLSKNTALRVFFCSDNSLTSLDIRGMRGVSSLQINAGGDNDKNLLTTFKVHDNIKQHAEIKEVHTQRGSALMIEVYTAPPGSTVYTQSCDDYNPNDNVCVGRKLTSFTIAAAGGVTELGLYGKLQFRVTEPKPADADKRVTWRVESGSGSGSIDANGLYTAPGSIPNPARITIKATTVLDNTIMATYNLKITHLATIPDANFRAKLKAIIPNAFAGDILDTRHADVTGLQKLDVKSSSISSLAGIQYFTSLDALTCNNNNLTSLDCSSNTNLNSLVCNSNSLTSLNISKNKVLTYLSCFGNQLTTLQISNNPALESLFCRSNGLTSLDVSKNTALEDLYCTNNNLTSLDLSKNTALRVFSCSNNSLTSLDIRGMRSVSFLDINAGDSNDKNLLTTLKVHENIKQHDEIKEAKTNRGSAVTIEVYMADADSATYTELCGNYNPNNNTCN